MPISAALLLLVGCKPSSPSAIAPDAPTFAPPPKSANQAPDPRNKVIVEPPTPLSNPGRTVKLSIASNSIRMGRENPISVVAFEIRNDGDAAASHAVVQVFVSDVRGTEAEISGEGFRCHFVPKLEPGKSSAQEFPIPRYIRGITEIAQTRVVVIEAE